MYKFHFIGKLHRNNWETYLMLIIQKKKKKKEKRKEHSTKLDKLKGQKMARLETF